MSKPLERTSISVDEAVAILLDWFDEPVEFTRLGGDDDDDACPPIFDIREVLAEELEFLISDHAEAKYNRLDEMIIAEKHAALQQHQQVIDRANAYLCAIDDEINKGDRSELRVATKLSNPAYTYITLASFREWVGHRPQTLTCCPIAVGSGNAALPPANEEPWLIAIPNDPPADQYWYTPARYFARQLIREDASLLTKRKVLAQKVVRSLEAVGIYKRGGVKPFDPSTVLKAFVSIKF